MLKYEKGQLLTNAFEVNEGSAVVIEIVDIFTDTEDDDYPYYICKCRKHGNTGFSWYYEDEVVLLDEGFLYKYFSLVKEDS